MAGSIVVIVDGATPDGEDFFMVRYAWYSNGFNGASEVRIEATGTTGSLNRQIEDDAVVQANNAGASLSGTIRKHTLGGFV